MDSFPAAASLSRRRFVTAAALSCAPFAAPAIGVYTPNELAREYAQRVTPALRPPEHEVQLYGSMAEFQITTFRERVAEPQYLLLVDSNPAVQAAFLVWRLMAGYYQLIGASPASTGGPVRPEHLETPQGVFRQTAEGADVPVAPAAACELSGRSCRRSTRVFDFGLQRARRATGTGSLFEMRLQVRAADQGTNRGLGSALSNGCILLPPSMINFIDEFGLLDADAGPRGQVSERLPFKGRYLLVVDSEREDRPRWCKTVA